MIKIFILLYILQEIQQKIEETKRSRDDEIKHLESLPYRNPKNEERLRKLILEREFQRRAAEENEDDEEDDDLANLSIDSSSLMADMWMLLIFLYLVVSCCFEIKSALINI